MADARRALDWDAQFECALDPETAKKRSNAVAEWLAQNGYTKNTNCVASVNAVCLKKKCTTGYGYRKKAYGFGWEYAEK